MKKRLSELCQLPKGVDDLIINGVTADSRGVAQNFIFAAIVGEAFDGRDFISAAIELGAVAIILDSSSDVPEDVINTGVALIFSDNPRRDYALACAAFYDQKPSFLAAITGTNGKTSVADFTRQIWKAAGLAAASMGTLGIRADLVNSPGGLTTPDPVKLHKNLTLMAEAGVGYCALEASSHGIDQDRLAGLTIKAAAFTNLSRDHLDYHADEEDYFETKARLFTDYLQVGGVAAVHIDNAYGKRLTDRLKAAGVKTLTVGHTIEADVCVVSIIPRDTGLEVGVILDTEKLTLHIPLMGVFQADNAILAACLASTAGLDLKDCLKATEQLQGVSGRMQYLGNTAKGGAVYVDFAHTPDGLENVLYAARAHTEGALTVLFGCGGNRDKGKRAIMGEIAARLADRVYVTDDNPRFEDAGQIRQEILAACPGAIEIADRKEAIKAAITALGKGEILVLAGKGHEEGQIVGDQVLPFSDIRTVHKMLNKSKSMQALKALQ